MRLGDRQDRPVDPSVRHLIRRSSQRRPARHQPTADKADSHQERRTDEVSSWHDSLSSQREIRKTKGLERESDSSPCKQPPGADFPK